MIINNYFHENNYRVSGLQREREYWIMTLFTHDSILKEGCER